VARKYGNLMNDLVSIIIVNYNTEKLLEECILSVIEYTEYIDYEIIVLDNNSQEGSLDKLISSYPQVSFQLLNENLGFGKANKVGAKIAKGEYLFFLNPDTLLINNAVLELYRFSKENPKTGICGGNLYKEDMSPAVSYHILDFYKREFMILRNKKWQIGFNLTDKPQEVNVIMGADLFIRKSLFEEAGGFDSDFFMYFEEVELCDRILKKGYKIMSVPSAKIIHLEGAAAENKTDELKKWSYQEHWYSKFVYFFKVKGRFKTFVLYSANILKFKLALCLYGLRGNSDKINYWNLKKEIIKKSYDRYKIYLKSRK